ncbi:UDP-glucose 4-epimerase [Pseudonocardiaceae bacterium YIM PH 21723]|nr:UDP-glucose 4-epimerase [Pseudonocardiaceae bacterium YIM PH 21723]
MRVLVTGGTGYLGQAVVRELLACGHVVYTLSRRRVAGPGVPRIGDLQDRTSLSWALQDVDTVVHLAALAKVRESFSDPLGYYRTNLVGTMNLLEAMAGSGLAKRLVFASTGSVYGTPDHQPITEQTPPAPTNPYAASKLAAEQAIGWQAACGSLGAVTLRLFNAAGAAHGVGDTDDTRVLSRVVAVAAGRVGHFDQFGDGSAVRDFVHVLDVARAFGLALSACQPGTHQVFNLGGTPASVADILDTTEQVTGRRVRVVVHPPNPGEVRELRASTELVQHVLEWKPEHSSLPELVRTQWEFERTRSR